MVRVCAPLLPCNRPRLGSVYSDGMRSFTLIGAFGRWFASSLLMALLPFAHGGEAKPEPKPAGARFFLGFSKSMSQNPVAMQQRGYAAVQQINDSLARLGFAGELLQEPIKAANSTPSVPSSFLVNSAAIKDRLASCRQKLGPNDTLILYSHSHGAMSRNGRLGGLVLDDGSEGGSPPMRCFNWSEYGEALLEMPAHTVVVLTMSCFSGGLCDYLNQPAAKARWQSRQAQGRNFLVITSQNARASSNPRLIDGQVINPFTHAVTKALGGAADGYARGRAQKNPDGKLTLGELADFITDETRKHISPQDKANDPDPQMLGSFDREFVLATLPSVPAK